MKNLTLKQLTAVFILGLFAVASFWYVQHSRLRPQASKIPTTSAISSVDTSTWQTYSNSEYKYEISYPKNYLVRSFVLVQDGNTLGGPANSSDSNIAIGEVASDSNDINRVNLFASDVVTISAQKHVAGYYAPCPQSSVFIERLGENICKYVDKRGAKLFQ